MIYLNYNFKKLVNDLFFQVGQCNKCIKWWFKLLCIAVMVSGVKGNQDISPVVSAVNESQDIAVFSGVKESQDIAPMVSGVEGSQAVTIIKSRGEYILEWFSFKIQKCFFLLQHTEC